MNLKEVAFLGVDWIYLYIFMLFPSYKLWNYKVQHFETEFFRLPAVYAKTEAEPGFRTL
jgi:hypothetical protein